MLTSCAAPSRPTRSESWMLGQETNNSSAESRGITNWPVMVDRWKNDLQCTRHTLADRFTHHHVRCLRFLPPDDQRRLGEIRQHVTCDVRWWRCCEQQRNGAGVVIPHRLDRLRLAVGPARRELEYGFHQEPGRFDGVAGLARSGGWGIDPG